MNDGILNSRAIHADKALAGAVGSLCEIIARQPILAIQTNSIVNRCNFSNAARNIYNAGGMLKFYDGAQGFSIAYIARALHRTGTFIMNDELRKRGFSTPAIAVLAALYEVAVTGVSDTVLTLTQAQSKKEHNTTPLTAFKGHVSKHGIKKVLGAGFGGSLARNTVFNIGYLGIGNAFPEFKEREPVMTGIVSGAAAVIVSHPFEVVRARQVSSPLKSFIDIFIDAMKLKNIAKTASSGLALRLLSTGIGSAISYVVYNKVLLNNKVRSDGMDVSHG